MHIKYDRNTCTGMFQCVHEWDAFEENRDAGKANLSDAEETENGVFVREIPEDAEFNAKMAARVCPVEAIRVFDDGEQIVP